MPDSSHRSQILIAPPQSKPSGIQKPQKQTITRAAKPTREIFDAFNSSATGHQRADNRLSGSTSWRDSRSLKLAEQFRAGLGGGKRIADTVGAGSEDFGKDGRTANGGWLPGTKGLRGKGQQSLWESFAEKKDSANVVRESRDGLVGDAYTVRRDARITGRLQILKNSQTSVKTKDISDGLDELEEMLYPSWTDEEMAQVAQISDDAAVEQQTEVPKTSQELYEEALLASPEAETIIGHDIHDVTDTILDSNQHDQANDSASAQSNIFRNLTIYVNGSTAPLISDHKLKRILVDNGANVSIALGRRSVTHVVLGPRRGHGARGAGGGLASSKIHKEITQLRHLGNGVKFVSAEWVVDSVGKGKRLPEAHYECLRLAPNGVKSVASMFKAKQ